MGGNSCQEDLLHHLHRRGKQLVLPYILLALGITHHHPHLSCPLETALIPQNQTEAAHQGRANIPAPTSPGSPGSPQGRYFCLHDASWRAPTSPGAASVCSYCCVLVAAASPLKYLNNPPRDLTSPFLSSFFLFLKQLAWLMPSAIHQLIQAEAVN